MRSGNPKLFVKRQTCSARARRCPVRCFSAARARKERAQRGLRGRAAERVRRRPTLIVAAQGSSIGQPLRVGTPPCGPAPRQARAPAALTRGRAAPHELYRFPLPSQHLPPSSPAAVCPTTPSVLFRSSRSRWLFLPWRPRCAPATRRGAWTAPLDACDWFGGDACDWFGGRRRESTRPPRDARTDGARVG